MLAFGGNPSLVNPLLANPSRRKTDKLDARLLAHHAITGMWPESYLASTSVQTARIAIMHRARLIRERTRLRNMLNNIVRRFGHTMGAYYRPASATGYSMFEDFSEGKLPKMKGIPPIEILESVRPVMRCALTKIKALNKEVYDANRAMLAAVKAAEFGTKGGELVSGEILLEN